jgi:hypothetical protein
MGFNSKAKSELGHDGKKIILTNYIKSDIIVLSKIKKKG